MSRPVFFLILLLLLIAGGAYYLSTLPTQAPTQTIEVDVAQPGNAN